MATEVDLGASSLRSAFDAAYGAANVSAFLRARLDNRIFTFDEGVRVEGSSFMQERDPSWPHSHQRFDALGPVMACPNLHSFGRGDGGKRVCMLPHGRTGSLNQRRSRSPCTIISIGSAGQYDFEAAMLRRFPAYHVHTFDCTLTHKSGEVPSELKHQLTLHPICIGARNETKAIRDYHGKPLKEKRSFLTWAAIMNRLGLHAPPAVLKLDIEGYEWDILPEIVRAPTLLPESISVELHYQTQMSLPWYGRFRTPDEIGAWMDYMFTRGGYVLVDRQDNMFCAHCSEIVVARIARPTAVE